MSDYNITPEAHQAYRSILMTTPFHPIVRQTDVEEWEIKFNQAYILDYLNTNNLASPIAIGNMDVSYVVNAIDKVDTYYYVEIEVDTSTGTVLYANFVQQTTPQAEITSDNLSLKIDGGGQTTLTQVVHVATFKKSTPVNLYLRDNIHWWGRKIKQEFGANTDVAQIINTGNLTGNLGNFNQPLQIKAISGNGTTNYKPVEVFNSGNDLIIVSGVTGFGVMYGNSDETYGFLSYPSDAGTGNIYVLACNSPLGNPYWLGTSGCTGV